MNDLLHFLRPDQFLFAFAAVIAGFVGTGFSLYVARLVARHLHPSLLIDRMNGHLVRSGLQFFALILLAATLLGPAWGYNTQTRSIEQKDVYLAVDMSTSMLATDLSPSRLQLVRESLQVLTDQYPQFRYGLVLFAGQAWIRIPLTWDHSYIHSVLEQTSPQDLTPQGTDIYQPLKQILQQIESEKSDGATVILVSDGEHNGPGKLEQLIPELVKRHVRMITVAVGTPEGAPVPLPAGGYARNTSGEMIFSTPDFSMMKRLANQTDGAAVDLDDSATAWDKIADAMSAVTSKGIKSLEIQSWHDRSFWFLIPALFLLALSLLPVTWLGRPLHKSTWTRRSAHLLLLFLLLPSWGCRSDKEGVDAYNSEDFKAAALYFSNQAVRSGQPDHLNNLGASLYQLKQYPSAMTAFLLAATRTTVPEGRAEHLYNAGNASFRAGDLMRAIGLYRESLALHDDEDARINLEIAKKRLQEMQQQMAQQQQEQKQSSEEGEEQEQKGQNSEQKQESEDDKESDEEQSKSEQAQASDPRTQPQEKSGKKSRKEAGVLSQQRLEQLKEGKPKQPVQGRGGNSATPW